jgi:xanthosine utilization system XapX-like protein
MFFAWYPIANFQHRQWRRGSYTGKDMEQGNPRSHRAALALTVMGALLRLAPHPPNFAPIGATGLFSGMRLRGWQAYLVPLIAMLLTDPIRSAMEGHFPAYSAMTVVIYASMLVYVFLGRTLLSNASGPGRIALVCLLGSTQFFLVTNFFVWLGAEVVYPHTHPPRRLVLYCRADRRLSFRGSLLVFRKRSTKPHRHSLIRVSLPFSLVRSKSHRTASEPPQGTL